MKNKKTLTYLLITAIFLLSGLGCKNIGLPFGGGGGLSEATDPKTAVTASFKKFMDVKSYHSVIKSKNAQAEVETELDFNAPDRFWIKNNVGNYKSEVIAVGSDSYSRTNDGKWTKMPAGNALSVAEMRGKMTEESFAAMKDFEAAGKENVNGKETFVYKFKSTYGGESTSTVWIAADSGLPVKLDSDGVYGGNSVKITVTYDYDKETKIEAPKIN